MTMRYRMLWQSRERSVTRRLALAALLLNLASCGAEDDIPKLSLEVEAADLKKLKRVRGKALKLGVLFSSDEHYVPAVLRYGEHEYGVKIRPKGDLPDHFGRIPYSLRVKLNKNERIFGMSRFSLNVPSTRGYVNELLFLDFVRERGILAPRALLVRLEVSGVDFGTMQLEEHFARELFLDQDRPEGLILKFDERESWLAWVAPQLDEWTPEFNNWRAAPIQVFQQSRIRKDPELSAQLETAASLLRGVMEEKLPPSDGLDPELWGRHLAACELFSSHHMLYWINLRMYYNPLTGLLEPIAADGNSHPGRQPQTIFQCQGNRLGFAAALHRDPRVRASFLRNLRRLSREVQSEAFLTDLSQRESSYLSAFETPEEVGKRFQLDALASRAAWMETVDERRYPQMLRPSARVDRRPLDPPDADYPMLVRARHWEAAKGRQLELSNALSQPVEIASLRFADPELEEQHPAAALLKTVLPLRLAPSRWPDLPTAHRFALPPSLALVLGAAPVVEGSARIVGTRHLHGFTSRPSYPARSERVVPESTLAETLQRHPFLERDPATDTMLRARPGSWEVSGWLVLPPGFGLTLAPGTTLRFESKAGLISRGPLRFSGSADNPVVLEGRQVGAGDWAGLAGIGAGGTHQWQHVWIRGTTGVALRDWRLPGGVTLRGDRVELSQVMLEGSRAKNALHLVGADFVLREVTIEDAAADALDMDACRGQVEALSIARVGSDALDLGRTQIEAKGLRIEEVRGDAISADANSDVALHDVSIAKAHAGIVSKNGSHVRIEGGSLTQIGGAALLAYRGKSGRAPAILTARDLTTPIEAARAVAEHGSQIQLDGRSLPTSDFEPEKLRKRSPAQQ